MRIDLSGKTALVTGSTSGIGFAVATGLAGAGAAVVVNGRSQDRTDAAVANLERTHPSAAVRGVAADLGTAAGCAALVTAVPAVDILVNNAGIFELGDFFEVEDEAWERHFAVNVMAGVRLSRAYLPGMERAGWGRVVFISSESGLNIPVEMIHYGVSKTADLAVSRGLAKRMAGTGVTVNAVLPGPTLSDGVVALLRPQAGGSQAGGSQAGDAKAIEQAGREFVAQHRPSSILRRAASVEEVANMVVYAASPQASATTGAALRVDGGVVDTIA